MSPNSYGKEIRIFLRNLAQETKSKEELQKVKKGDIVGAVEIELVGTAEITSVITEDSINELNLKVGDEVNAVIKATEVMISK
jgi:molybdopterin-binding protein